MSDTIVERFTAAVIAARVKELEHLAKKYTDREDRYANEIKRITFASAFASSDSGPFVVDGDEFVLVHEQGGREGEGEYVQHVFGFEDTFIEVTGTYTSWDGTDWDYGYVSEVSPREVTRIEYS